MIVQKKIESNLNLAFSPVYLDVKNESHMHHSGRGLESHFKVVVVSANFEGQSLITRHRAINSALEYELKNDIHALAIHTYTPTEWLDIKAQAPNSIPCQGFLKSKNKPL